MHRARRYHPADSESYALLQAADGFLSAEEESASPLRVALRQQMKTLHSFRDVNGGHVVYFRFDLEESDEKVAEDVDVDDPREDEIEAFLQETCAAAGKELRCWGLCLSRRPVVGERPVRFRTYLVVEFEIE